MAMANQKLVFQDFNRELIGTLENLKSKREEIQSLIDIEEAEKANVQSEMESSRDKLSSIINSLNKKTAAIAEFDRSIAESETTICRILENSKTIADKIHKEINYPDNFAGSNQNRNNFF